MRTAALPAVLAVAALLPGVAAADPGFDCARAVTPTELAICAGPGRTGAPGDPAGIGGVYCARDGADALVVEVRGDVADFALSSWQANGHHCGTPTLTARRAADAWVAQDGGCTFRLFTEGGALVLAAAPFETCKMQYCGARAAISRFAFPTSARRPLPAPAREVSLMEGDVCR
jgi:hypothetical protein